MMLILQRPTLQIWDPWHWDGLTRRCSALQHSWPCHSCLVLMSSPQKVGREEAG